LLRINREIYKVQLPNRPTNFKITVVKLYLQPELEEPNKEPEEKPTKEPTEEPTKEPTKELTKELTEELAPSTPHQKSKRTQRLPTRF
jgi:hypothetical protein